MSSRLLDQSLGQLRNDRRQPSGGASSRNSPYNRNARNATAADDDGKWKHDRFDAHASSTSSRGGPRGGRASSAGGSLKPTGKLTVDNLHYEVSEAELRDLFERIGPVVKAFIKYDRSGRSTGQAVVIYEQADDATAAKGEYDGAKAKGQVISIQQEMRPERVAPTGAAGGARGGATANAGGKDLLSRFDLLSRLGGSKPEPPRNAPRGPASETRQGSGGRSGPTRSVSGGGSGGRQQRGGGAAAGGVGGREKRKPATQADLDAELEAFMKAPSSASASASTQSNPVAAAAAAPPTAPAPNSTAASIHAAPTEDVEMS